jgi:hypothetical protein
MGRKPPPPHRSPSWVGPAGSQIEAAAATVEPVCGKDRLGLVMAENQTEQLTHSDTPSNADIGTSCVIVYVPTGDTGFETALDQLLSELDEQELRLRYYERLSDEGRPVHRRVRTSTAGERPSVPASELATELSLFEVAKLLMQYRENSYEGATPSEVEPWRRRIERWRG